jgi:hypothetical protein
MKRGRLHVMILLATCFVVTSSCSQKNSTVNLSAPEIFAGSTPCDSLIKSLLEIPSVAKCDFIKWELRFGENSSGTFQLTALYGESQPNTNGFIGGGKKIEVHGKYTIGPGPGAKIYSLHAEGLESSLLLIQMDNNIFHFADARKKFIVGNGGWGYVLNRIQ